MRTELTQREKQALSLLQEEMREVRAHLTELNGQVQDYMAQFDEIPNTDVIATARRDPRFDKDVLAPTMASVVLVVMENWKKAELGVDGVLRHLWRLEAVIRSCAMSARKRDEIFHRQECTQTLI